MPEKAGIGCRVAFCYAHQSRSSARVPCRTLMPMAHMPVRFERVQKGRGWWRLTKEHRWRTAASVWCGLVALPVVTGKPAAVPPSPHIRMRGFPIRRCSCVASIDGRTSHVHPSRTSARRGRNGRSPTATAPLMARLNNSRASQCRRPLFHSGIEHLPLWRMPPRPSLPAAKKIGFRRAHQQKSGGLG